MCRNTDVISINDSGVVAFPSTVAAQVEATPRSARGTGVRRQPCGHLHRPGLYDSPFGPSISNTGAVAFVAASGNSFDHVIRAKNGALVTIAGPGTSPRASGRCRWRIEPSINNNDVVTFMGQGGTPCGHSSRVRAEHSPPFRSTVRACSTASTTLGRVAFLANPLAVQTGDGGPVTTIATRTFEGGTYQSFTAAERQSTRPARWRSWHPCRQAWWAFSRARSGSRRRPQDGRPLRDSPGSSRDSDGHGHHARGHQRQRSGGDGRSGTTTAKGHAKFAIIRADPPNSPPVASDDSFSVTAGGSVSDTLSATDPDTEPITYSIVTNGAKGTAVLDNVSTGCLHLHRQRERQRR